MPEYKNMERTEEKDIFKIGSTDWKCCLEISGLYTENAQQQLACYVEDVPLLFILYQSETVSSS